MRILFLSRWYPYPPDNGSKIRIYNLLKQLATQHEVTLLSFFDPAEAAPQPLPPGLCCEVRATPWLAYRPMAVGAMFGLLSLSPRSQAATYSHSMAEMVAATLAEKNFDIVICSQLGTVEYANGLTHIPAILEELEVGPILGSANHRLPPRQWVRLKFTRTKLRLYLRRLLPRFAACTVASQVERTLVQEVVHGYRAVHVLPNAVDVDVFAPDDSIPTPFTIIYPGALTYSSNFDAMRYFLAECYPLIRREVPDVRVIITGRSDGVKLEELALDPSVFLTGYVPDVRPLLRQSWACVVPLRMGGGTRLKILEAMALGTPVVATTKGAEGLDVIDGKQILLADTPQRFAIRTLELLRQPTLRAQLATQARNLVVERYSLGALREDVNTLLGTALAEYRARPRQANGAALT